jgi:flavin-dependent dehydrogenase
VSTWWDVVILGGGTAGCAAALALAKRGVPRVCVVEPGHGSAARVGESIPPDARILLQQLGVWEGFLEQGHEPCLGSCSSWGSDALGYNDFMINPYGSGWHLDRPRFDASLADRAVAMGVSLRAEGGFAGVEPLGDEGFRLTLSEPGAEPLDARFVVDATGARSVFARRLGATQLPLDRLMFVYGFFDVPEGAAPSRLTMLEAVPEGWWYAARLPDRRLAVAFASDPETIQEGGLARIHGWFPRLLRTRHVAPRLSGCRLCPDSLVVRAAPSFLLDQAAGDRWIAVGDAAAAYDPIASQGIYKALEGGLAAGEIAAARLDSPANRAHEYHAATAARFADYLAIRNHFYGLEERWADAPFWRRRRERAALGRA